ncbi:MAG: hypothetical protein J6D54_00075 [Olsenella sp.]|nr:hypothetical protein [Olsenella sp.]
MDDQHRLSRSTTGSFVARLAPACALALLLGATMPGCAQSQGGSSPSPASTASAQAPAPTAEVADVTTVAYLGPAGTYTEEAAKLFFGDNDELMPQSTVAEALALVANGTATYAVVPQENTLGGPVTDYIDALLAASDVKVVGEVVLPIRQTLMGLSGTDLSKVTRVVSHKQGLAQSSAWLDKNLPGAERVEAPSTAAAARQVSEGGDPTVVAIAAPGAADLYGLEVLQKNVSQSEANKTRFYVASRKANALPGYGCAVFEADVAAGELPALLGEACSGGTTLVCVHDRPEGSGLGVYRYVIELARDGGFADEEITRLERDCKLRCLGRFARMEG